MFLQSYIPGRIFEMRLGSIHQPERADSNHQFNY